MFRGRAPEPLPGATLALAGRFVAGPSKKSLPFSAEANDAATRLKRIKQLWQQLERTHRHTPKYDALIDQIRAETGAQKGIWRMNHRTPPGASSETIPHSSQGWPWASAAMRELEDDIACAIQSDAKVMITGKRGVGKRFVAHLIHQRSRRGPAPFVIATCPDVVEWLLQFSVLHTRFASESADQFKHGLLKTANNGTLLIEEIQKIPLPVQPRLLRFIESEMTNGSDVRLMTATRTDLFERVRSSQFRDGLFYRLNVIHLIIPALRDRPEDIPILLRHYLSFYGRAEVPRLSTAAWQRLVAYPWPGNVQELKAVTEKLAVRDPPRLVEPDDLPPEIGR